MAITHNEATDFVKSLRKSVEEFTGKIEEFSQSTSGEEVVNFQDDEILNEDIEVLIIALKQFAGKAGIIVY